MGSFTFEGRRVAWREQGSGPPLLILPGSTASSAHHAGELAHFGRRFRALALDLPGTGLSERLDVWPAEWWERGAEAALALRRHLALPPAVLVGTSGGAVVALHAAAREPAAVRAVVADSAVTRYDPELLRRVVGLRRVFAPEAEPFWRQGHGEDWERVIEADGAFLEGVGARGGDPFGGALERVRCPVLFTASLGDELLRGIGAEQVEFLRRVRGGRAFVVREGRHPMIWTRAEAFRAAADAFLEGV